MNVMINNSLQFGLDQEFTGTSLRDIAERYIRLGLITSMDDVDEVMDLAWTRFCNFPAVDCFINF